MESLVVQSGLLPCSLSGSAHSPTRRVGVCLSVGRRNERSVGREENVREGPADGLQMVFGENRGDRAEDSSGATPYVSLRKCGLDGDKARSLMEIREPKAIAAALVRG